MFEQELSASTVIIIGVIIGIIAFALVCSLSLVAVVLWLGQSEHTLGFIGQVMTIGML